MTQTLAATSIDDTKRLQCLEVWGGNRFVSTSVQMPGLDAWIYSMPADGEQSVGGGDVHYVSSCAAGAVTRLLIADVAGHGAEVSDTARRLRKLMQRNINFHTQARFVRQLNAEFIEMAQAGRFATAVAFTYDAPPNRLLVCNAGHPAPLVWRSARRNWEFLEPDNRDARNFPLGIVDAVDYEQFDAPIAVGDLVLVFTDALIESRRADGSMLESAGALELVRKLDVSSPAALIASLLTAISTCGCTIGDDLTLLLFRPNGSRPRVPLKDHVLAPIRVLRNLIAGTIR